VQHHIATLYDAADLDEVFRQCGVHELDLNDAVGLGFTTKGAKPDVG